MPKHHASCSTQERPRMALQRPTFPSVRRTEGTFYRLVTSRYRGQLSWRARCSPCIARPNERRPSCLRPRVLSEGSTSTSSLGSPGRTTVCRY